MHRSRESVHPAVGGQAAVRQRGERRPGDRRRKSAEREVLCRLSVHQHIEARRAHGLVCTASGEGGRAQSWRAT